jgi:hypothetical protein
VIFACPSIRVTGSMTISRDISVTTLPSYFPNRVTALTSGTRPASSSLSTW